MSKSHTDAERKTGREDGDNGSPDAVETDFIREIVSRDVQQGRAASQRAAHRRARLARGGGRRRRGLVAAGSGLSVGLDAGERHQRGGERGAEARGHRDVTRPEH